MCTTIPYIPRLFKVGNLSSQMGHTIVRKNSKASIGLQTTSYNMGFCPLANSLEGES